MNTWEHFSEKSLSVIEPIALCCYRIDDKQLRTKRTTERDKDSKFDSPAISRSAKLSADNSDTLRESITLVNSQLS